MSHKDIFNFMKQLQSELSSEYSRIQERVTEDPGTAGDEGEENWAELLREWLPSNYIVVTKGRIINVEGDASPQIDILVLHPAYPKHLVNKKHYLAGGVIAAFECKLTLRVKHFEKAFSNSAKIKKLLDKRSGTPYKELTQPIIYGLLAHSHSWKDNSRSVALSLVEKISDRQFNGPEHPSELIDIICVSDLGTYTLGKTINIKPGLNELKIFSPNDEIVDEDEDIEKCNHIVTCYTCSWDEDLGYTSGTVLGAFVSNLIKRIAYEDPSIRSIADYYRSTMESGGIGLTTVWYPTILSDNVVQQLKSNGPSEEPWSEWEEHL